ncbi:hypothetical protein B0H11DRAFT_1010338 [Mycena galericulata]|nr:hypothetical protein B0H11DRAFT_1010338 [Mycena galericulata]
MGTQTRRLPVYCLRRRSLAYSLPEHYSKKKFPRACLNSNPLLPVMVPPSVFHSRSRCSNTSRPIPVCGNCLMNYANTGQNVNRWELRIPGAMRLFCVARSHTAAWTNGRKSELSLKRHFFSVLSLVELFSINTWDIPGRRKFAPFLLGSRYGFVPEIGQWLMNSRRLWGGELGRASKSSHRCRDVIIQISFRTEDGTMDGGDFSLVTESLVGAE